MNSATIRSLTDFLARLRAAHIYYSLSDHTQTAIMVEIAVPGERWEVEFHEDGQIGVELFVSDGNIRGADALNSLFEQFGN